MKYFDKMNVLGMEINNTDEKYYLSYNTGDHIGSIDTLEISKEDAERMKEIYAPFEGQDIKKLRATENGKKALKNAWRLAREILFFYKNKRDGLI